MIFSIGPKNIQQLAAELLSLDQHYKRRRVEMLSLMMAEGIHKVDLPGGSVSFVKASTSSSIDGRTCAERLTQLGARLRALGVADFEDAIPMNVTNRQAGVRISLRE